MKIAIDENNCFTVEEEKELQPFLNRDITLDDIRNIASLGISLTVVYKEGTDSLVLDHPYAW